MGKSTGRGLTKGYTATAAIGARRIVKFGAADSTVVLGAAATDRCIGVSTDLAAAIGERCDVSMTGSIGEVILGGAVTRGASVTSDAAGAGVAAAATNFAIGQAESSGVAGDIIGVIINPHVA